MLRGMNTRALKTVARLTRTDLVAAIQSKRHNPILDSEIHIEEELINLQESLDTSHTAGETLKEYPQIYAHISNEKKDIMKHCIGLVIRMMNGRALPRPYTREDIDFAVKRLVQLVVLETRRAGIRLDKGTMEIFRPYLTVRQRLALRDYRIDLVVQATQLHRAAGMAGRLPLLRSK
jgi:hypothetical protein